MRPVAFSAGLPPAYTHGHYQRNVSQSHSVAVIGGFPKPCVAGSIPPGGTWTTCGSCNTSCQVPYDAESVG
jgi:hypothetical protein